MEVMRFQISSRRDFERLRITDPATLTDIERAARFLYLQKLGFGGKVNSVFGVSVGSPRFSMSRLEPILDAACERLDGVVFECLDWASLIPRYDSAETLFYLDPPYFGGEDDYGKGMFDRAQFVKMSEVLSAVDGAFVLSINDTPEIRDVFSAFHLEEVKLKYTVGKSGTVDASELFVSNREVAVGLF
jgi:DNA adenine methylase